MNWNECLDRTGTLASSLCAVHCCTIPFIIGALPVIGAGFLATHAFEWFMISLAAVLGGIATFFGFRIHRNYTVIFLFLTGIFLLTANRWVLAATGNVCCSLHTTPQTGFPWDVLPSVMGGMLVTSAHVVNQHLCKRCPTCDEIAESCNPSRNSIDIY